MNKLFSSLVAFFGVWAFLVFFSSQLPQEQAKKYKPVALDLKELEAKEEKPKEQPQAAAGLSQAQLAAEGQAYMRAGGAAGEGELPRINGDADEQTYLEYSRISGAKLLVYSPGLKEYLGELKASGAVPVIVPVDVVRFKADYPSEGRLVKDPGLLSMAAVAAARKGKKGSIKLYMALRNKQHMYLLGKLVATLRGEGLEIKDVATVDARYLVINGAAKIVLVSAMLKTGEIVKLKDLEA